MTCRLLTLLVACWLLPAACAADEREPPRRFDSVVPDAAPGAPAATPAATGGPAARPTLAATSGTSAQVAPAADEGPATSVPLRPWAHERSDVPPFERLRFGHLANGLRYVWLDHAVPAGQLALRLHVAVGSTAEADDEQGLAHVLEHMVYRGSAHYPPGALQEWLARHGLPAAPHAHSATGFDETVFRLDLTEADSSLLREALTVFADIGGGLDLDPAELAAVQQIIDDEEPGLDAGTYHVGVESLRRRFAGTAIAERIPLGTRASRLGLSVEALRAFHERYYHPGLMTLVLVGDLGGSDPVPLIREVLSGLDGSRPLVLPPAPGTPRLAEADRNFALHDPAATAGLRITLGRLWPWEPRPITAARLVDEVPLLLARAMIGARLDALMRRESLPLVAVTLGSAQALDLLDGEQLVVNVPAEGWELGLATADAELRRALVHGFREPELVAVVDERLAALDDAVRREGERTSESWATELLAAAAGRTLPSSAATETAILRGALQAATVAACEQALRERWQSGQATLTAVGGLDLGKDGLAVLQAALDAGRSQPLPPPEPVAAFAYASVPGVAGEVVERQELPELGVHLLRFANGVRLNLRPSLFEEREVLLMARVGKGPLALSPEASAVGFVASLPGVLGSLGLARHDRDELERLVAGRAADLSFSVAEDHLVLQGGTTPVDLLLALELLAARLSDPGWRGDGLQRALAEELPELAEHFARSPAGPVQQAFLPALHGGDRRFGVPTFEDLRAVDLPALRAWLEPQLLTGPVELTLVGDLDVEAAVAAVARTLGTLPPREEVLPFTERPPVALVPALRQDIVVDAELPAALVLLVFGTTDGRDAGLRRRLSMLSTVLAERLRRELGPVQGATYVPGVRSVPSRAHPGLGTLSIDVGAEPGRVEAVRDACLAVVEQLVRDGVDPAELEPLRESVLTGIREQMGSNAYWLLVVSEMQSDPGRLQDARRMVTDYEELTADELSALARTYLDVETVSWVLVRPRSG